MHRQTNAQQADNFENRHKLEQLVAELCDGQLSPEQSRQLQQLLAQSEQARRFLAEYFYLHGELHWEQACSVVPLRLHRHQTRPMLMRTVPFVVAAAALFLILLGVWRLRPKTLVERQLLPRPKQPAIRSVEVVGRALRILGARWAAHSRISVGQPIVANQELELAEGAAELELAGNVFLLIQAPAKLVVQSADQIRLAYGAVSVRTQGNGKLVINTGFVRLVDCGTKFAVIAQQNGPCHLHVLEGKVAVYGIEAQSHSAEPVRVVEAGNACQVEPNQAGGVLVRSIRFNPAWYWGETELATCVARLRRVVAEHPRLVHHWTFEGIRPAEILRDHAGLLDLVPVQMYGGTDRPLQLLWPGVDPTTNAVRVARADEQGNKRGQALQTVDVFRPAKQMTVEMLFRYDGFRDREKGLGVLLGTRASATDCGFLLAAAAPGRLMHLMDANTSWLECDATLIPGHWYFVAALFRTETDRTIVSTYIADLTLGERQLKCTLQNGICVGTPPAGPLGIGKGFQAELAHAYPWPGCIDEIAIFDAVLDEQTLARHLDALYGDGNVAATEHFQQAAK